ncbi:MAG: glycosyl transferase group 1 [Candidatus Saccharibacteria bacterium]|nr:glycosyl transferase group 1 [Candidatus Saccharibacteria bacterium]
MRILFITRKYPPSTGGMELFAFDLYTSLAAKTDTRLIKWGGSGRVKAVLVALPYVTVKAFFSLLRGGVDVIHVQDGVLAPVGYLLSQLFRKPFTVVIHGLDITYKNPLYRKSAPWTVARADVVFCISEAASTEAQQRGVPIDKIVVIPLAVRDTYKGKTRPALLKVLDLPADAKILLTVGRLVKRKGVAWFIENVLPDLVSRHPEIVYLIVGDGEERSVVEAVIKKTDMGRHVRVLGRVSEEVRELAYSGADIFIMPNITVPGDMEGFGLVLLEASIYGLPVVATDTEGIKDAISNGKNGVLVPVSDPTAFGSAVERFLTDHKTAAKFGESSRAFTLATYQWDVLAERYIEQYKRLVK